MNSGSDLGNLDDSRRSSFSSIGGSQSEDPKKWSESSELGDKRRSISTSSTSSISFNEYSAGISGNQVAIGDDPKTEVSKAATKTEAAQRGVFGRIADYWGKKWTQARPVKNRVEDLRARSDAGGLRILQDRVTHLAFGSVKQTEKITRTLTEGNVSPEKLDKVHKSAISFENVAKTRMNEVREETAKIIDAYWDDLGGEVQMVSGFHFFEELSPATQEKFLSNCWPDITKNGGNRASVQKGLSQERFRELADKCNQRYLDEGFVVNRSSSAPLSELSDKDQRILRERLKGLDRDIHKVENHTLVDLREAMDGLSAAKDLIGPAPQSKAAKTTARAEMSGGKELAVATVKVTEEVSKLGALVRGLKKMLGFGPPIRLDANLCRAVAQEKPQWTLGAQGIQNTLDSVKTLAAEGKYAKAAVQLERARNQMVILSASISKSEEPGGREPSGKYASEARDREKTEEDHKHAKATPDGGRAPSNPKELAALGRIALLKPLQAQLTGLTHLEKYTLLVEATYEHNAPGFELTSDEQRLRNQIETTIGHPEALAKFYEGLGANGPKAIATLREHLLMRALAALDPEHANKQFAYIGMLDDQIAFIGKQAEVDKETDPETKPIFERYGEVIKTAHALNFLENLEDPTFQGGNKIEESGGFRPAERLRRSLGPQLEFMKGRAAAQLERFNPSDLTQRDLGVVEQTRKSEVGGIWNLRTATLGLARQLRSARQSRSLLIEQAKPSSPGDTIRNLNQGQIPSRKALKEGAIHAFVTGDTTVQASLLNAVRSLDGVESPGGRSKLCTESYGGDPMVKNILEEVMTRRPKMWLERATTQSPSEQELNRFATQYTTAAHEMGRIALKTGDGTLAQKAVGLLDKLEKQLTVQKKEEAKAHVGIELPKEEVETLRAMARLSDSDKGLSPEELAKSVKSNPTIRSFVTNHQEIAGDLDRSVFGLRESEVDFFDDVELMFQKGYVPLSKKVAPASILGSAVFEKVQEEAKAPYPRSSVGQLLRTMKEVRPDAWNALTGIETQAQLMREIDKAIAQENPKLAEELLTQLQTHYDKHLVPLADALSTIGRKINDSRGFGVETQCKLVFQHMKESAEKIGAFHGIAPKEASVAAPKGNPSVGSTESRVKLTEQDRATLAKDFEIVFKGWTPSGSKIKSKDPEFISAKNYLASKKALEKFANQRPTDLRAWIGEGGAERLKQAVRIANFGLRDPFLNKGIVTNEELDGPPTTSPARSTAPSSESEFKEELEFKREVERRGSQPPTEQASLMSFAAILKDNISSAEKAFLSLVEPPTKELPTAIGIQTMEDVEKFSMEEVVVSVPEAELGKSGQDLLDALGNPVDLERPQPLSLTATAPSHERRDTSGSVLYDFSAAAVEQPDQEEEMSLKELLEELPKTELQVQASKLQMQVLVKVNSNSSKRSQINKNEWQEAVRVCEFTTKDQQCLDTLQSIAKRGKGKNGETLDTINSGEVCVMLYKVIRAPAGGTKDTGGGSDNYETVKKLVRQAEFGDKLLGKMQIWEGGQGLDQLPSSAAAGDLMVKGAVRYKEGAFKSPTSLADGLAAAEEGEVSDILTTNMDKFKKLTKDVAKELSARVKLQKKNKGAKPDSLPPTYQKFHEMMDSSGKTIKSTLESMPKKRVFGSSPAGAALDGLKKIERLQNQLSQLGDSLTKPSSKSPDKAQSAEAGVEVQGKSTADLPRDRRYQGGKGAFGGAIDKEFGKAAHWGMDIGASVLATDFQIEFSNEKYRVSIGGTEFDMQPQEGMVEKLKELVSLTENNTVTWVQGSNKFNGKSPNIIVSIQNNGDFTVRASGDAKPSERLNINTSSLEDLRGVIESAKQQNTKLNARTTTSPSVEPEKKMQKEKERLKEASPSLTQGQGDAHRLGYIGLRVRDLIPLIGIENEKSVAERRRIEGLLVTYMTETKEVCEKWLSQNPEEAKQLAEYIKSDKCGEALKKASEGFFTSSSSSTVATEADKKQNIEFDTRFSSAVNAYVKDSAGQGKLREDVAKLAAENPEAFEAWRKNNPDLTKSLSSRVSADVRKRKANSEGMEKLVKDLGIHNKPLPTHPTQQKPVESSTASSEAAAPSTTEGLAEAIKKDLSSKVAGWNVDKTVQMKKGHFQLELVPSQGYQVLMKTSRGLVTFLLKPDKEAVEKLKILSALAENSFYTLQDSAEELDTTSKKFTGRFSGEDRLTLYGNPAEKGVSFKINETSVERIRGAIGMALAVNKAINES